jgi:glutamyl-tRNA synthetase
LFNWLYARKTSGEMILRIEDTDRERSTQEAIDVILEAMKWLGLTWNQGPFYQTRRFDRYDEIIRKLLDQGNAYYCFCSRERLDKLREEQRNKGIKPRYDGCCRELGRSPQEGEQAVVRFRNPLEGSVVFDDIVRGRVEISNQELDDLIIARSDGTPTYNLTVVVDDIDMNVSHVIRGDDHINNTPRQINIFTALGANLPVFAHVPMILGEDGQRLSKRHGAVSVLEYREMGILPEALLNYLVRLGWSHGDQEIFNIDEMIELFEIEGINRAPAAFNMEKLLWINQHYITTMDSSRLVSEVGKRMNARGIGVCHGPGLTEVVELMRERVQTLEQMADSIAYLYCPVEKYDEEAVSKHVDASTAALLGKVHAKFESMEQWDRENISAAIKQVVKEEGVKFPHIAQPLRIAVSGSVSTPSIDITLQLVGKTRTLERVEKAVKIFSKST